MGNIECLFISWMVLQNEEKERERKINEKNIIVRWMFSLVHHSIPVYSFIVTHISCSLSLSFSFIFDLMAIIRHARFSVNSWACIYGLASL